MLHIFFSWLPFTIGQVYSQVWCRPYLLAHIGFFDLRMFPWLPSKVQVVYFTPSHSKYMYVPSVTCAILVIWCVSFSFPVIHRNTDKARVQHSVEGNFYAADQGWIHSSAHHYLWHPVLSPLLWGQLFQYGTHPSHESNLLFMVSPCFLLVWHLMLALTVKQQLVHWTTVKVMRTCVPKCYLTPLTV